MDFPDVAQLLPHAAPMLLLRRVVAHEEAATTCEIDVKDSALFRRDDGRVPAYVAVEYMAQCIAAHGGLRARRGGEPVRPGLLLGARRVTLHCAEFTAGIPLLVAARHVHGEATGMLQFDCRVWSDVQDPLAAGRLNVFVPEDPSQLLQVGLP